MLVEAFAEPRNRESLAGKRHIVESYCAVTRFNLPWRVKSRQGLNGVTTAQIRVGPVSSTSRSAPHARSKVVSFLSSRHRPRPKANSGAIRWQM